MRRKCFKKASIACLCALLIMIIIVPSAFAYSHEPPECGGNQVICPGSNITWSSPLSDCFVFVHGTKNGGTVSLTNGVTDFPTASGIRQYSATAAPGYTFTRWVSSIELPNGTFNPTATYQKSKYLVSAVGDKTTDAGFVWENPNIQVNRPDWLAYGETDSRELNYYLYAVFEPIVTVTMDDHVSVDYACDYAGVSSSY
ncbi:MAG: hypothetical protein VB071_04870 [Lawsonibacter sp.]|nr:hypothetical protein [Lawsonibacter sp.]